MILSTSGAVGSSGNVFTTAIDRIGTSTVGGDLYITNDASLTLTGALTTAASNGIISLNAGVNTITSNAGSTIASGLGDITLTADSIALGANIAGTGSITLQPTTAAQSIGLAGGAGIFSLDSSEIAYLQNGFSNIYIGRSDGSGTININAVTFNDPTTIRSPNGAGSITVNGQITGSDNAAITLDGSAATTLNANIITSGNTITISDNVLLDSNVLLDATNGGASAGAAISITGTVDSVGAETNSLTLDADSAGGSGDVTISGAIGSTTALSSLTITGNDISLNSIGAAAAGVTGVTSITASNGADTGSITLSGTTYNANAQTYNALATNTIQLTGGIAGSTTTVTSSADTVQFTGLVDLNNRDLTIDTTNSGGSPLGASITFNQAIDGAGDFILTAGTAGDITLSGAVGGTTSLNSLTATANTISLNSVITNNGVINLNADGITLSGTINSGNAIITLLPRTSGYSIDLGTKTAGTLGLTSAEMDRLTTTNLVRIGNGSSGNIVISAAIAPANINTLTLQTGGTITQTASLTETNLRLDSAGAITMTNASNDVTTLAANVSGADNAFSYTDANSLIVGTVDGVAGITTNGGDLTLTAATDLTIGVAGVNQSITSNGGDIRMKVGGVTTFNGNVDSNNGDIYIENEGAGQAMDVGFIGGSGPIKIDPSGLSSNLLPGTGIIYLGSATVGDITIGDANFGTKNIGFITSGNINDRSDPYIHLLTANILVL
ncbi:MAG: hypothetical protein KJ722_07205, partial [Candidatus Omnitrophica bacterium]|nr:hypothetical protein [Candidatus Omnitrophota bacterium]